MTILDCTCARCMGRGPEDDGMYCPECGSEVVPDEQGIAFDCTADDCDWWYEPDYEAMDGRDE